MVVLRTSICGAVWASCASGQNLGLLSQTFSTSEVFMKREVRIDLKEDSISTGDLARLKLKVESLPSGEIVDPSHMSVGIDGDSSKYLLIRFAEPLALKLSDDKIKISVYLATSQAKAQDLDVGSETEFLNRYPETLEFAIKARLAYAKTSRERLFYISGGYNGGEAAINPVLYKGNVWKIKASPINQIDFGFALDKGAGSKADPDFLNIGLNFRKIFPLHRESIRNTLTQLSQFRSQSSSEKRQTLSRVAGELNQKNAFFRSVVLTPLAPRLETSLRGNGTGYLINFINNSDLQIRSGTKLLLGREDQSEVNKDKVKQAKQPHGTLTWDMKLIPLALEAGWPIRNPDDPSRKGNPIMRLNTGAVGKLTYHSPCRIDVFVDRIELEVKAMNRHLFDAESALNPLTNKADALVRGNKYAFETDFRYVFGYVLPVRFFRRRPTLTVTYKKGFFPPLYTYNNSVSVHFTLESEDDTNVSDMKVNVKQVEALRATGAP